MIGATKHAFETLCPAAPPAIVPVDVDSAAGDRPEPDEATRQGARTRALSSGGAAPAAEFRVGLQGDICSIARE